MPTAAVRHPDGRPLRILFIGDTLSPFTARLAGALARRGAVVAALNGPTLVKAAREQWDTDVRNVPYEERRLRGNVRVPALAGLEARMNRFRLWRTLARERADVIHVNNLYCGERLDRVAGLDRLPAPLVVSAFGSDVDDSVMVKHPSYPPLRERLLSLADLVTASSAPMVRRCRTFVPDRPERDFRLIHWYADPAVFNVETAQRGREAWRDRLQIPSDAIVILSPRNTAPNYQIDRIIRAFAQATTAGGYPEERYESAVLVVVHRASPSGPHRDYLNHLRELAAPLGTAVRFVEQVPYGETAGLFGMADVAVSIPKADGAAATHFEHLALGVPLIVADLEDYRGVIYPYQNAIAVDATDDEPLTRALKAVLTDNDLRKQLRAGALASAAEHGTFDDSVDAYIEAYREAMARAEQRRGDPFGICEVTYAGIGARNAQFMQA